MFKTKKDVDRHVRTALSKLHSENEKNLRGFTVAKLYFKIHEYATAQHYVSTYLSANEEYAPAHKLLGQCLLQLKKPDKALEAFQRSLNIDPKQPDLLIEVCKMLLSDESTTSFNKAKYWCDLAESENVQHNAVFSLRLKLLNKSSLESTQIEELIMKEISSRPSDPNLRVRIIKHFIEQNKVLEAFKYAYELEMNNHALFANCIDWYSIVWIAMNKFRQLPNTKKSWDFWLLSTICIEKQVDLSFTNMNNNLLLNGGTTEIANLLFTFDQHLHEAAKVVLGLSPEKELGAQFLYHFRGQLCLHAASLIYRREQVLNKNQWREATKNALPLLLFAFYCGTPDIKESWLKHSGEKTRQIIQTWHREGSFRCAQAGRTILSLMGNASNDSLSSQVHNVISDQSGWSNMDDILSQIRQHCSDNAWRTKLFRILFPNGDQLVKIQMSHLVNSDQLIEPTYEFPKRSDVESYEEVAQYLRPQSLQHMVYLCLGMDNLCDIKCRYFSGLNFSTQNLSFCGAESLTRLDMETFLCATTIQAQRSYEVERLQYENYNAKNVAKPRILPYANMSSNLCSESQTNWWQAAYQVYKNLAGDNLAELRATLQYGIEAVRGVNGPKMDLVIILKLAKIFVTRAQDANKSVERAFLDARAVTLYKYGLNMLKLHNKGVLEPFRKLFKYNNANSASVEREVNYLAEEAVTMIATRHFKNGDYEECIEELSGIQLPYATYFQAEAYRKLDESNKTPKKTKKFYCDKAKDCLEQTLQLLSFSNDKNHPLRSIVHTDMQRNHFTDVYATNDLTTEIEAREEFLNESFNHSRVQRDLQTSMSTNKTAELENLIKQMMSTLAFVKEELVDRIKPEVSDIKNDLALLKDKVIMIEERTKKKSEPPSRDDATKDFDDLYIIGEDLQPVVLGQYNQAVQQPQTTPAQQRMQTPNALLNQQASSMLHGAPMSAGANIYNSTLYNPMGGNMTNPLMNQQTSHGQYSNPTAGSSVYNPHYNPNYPFNYYSQFVMSPSVMGMVMPGQQQQPNYMSQTDNNPSLYDILSLANAPNVNPVIEKPAVDKPTSQPSAWNRLNNNAPVEKGPPVNVVITSSDPLPTHTTVSTQSTLSVTIPPHHIKQSLVPNDLGGLSQLQTNTSFPIITSSLNFGPSASIVSTMGGSVTATTQSFTTGIAFSMPKPVLSETNTLNKSNQNTDAADIHNTSADTEYEPQVDFQPVIPLPDEVDVKTGEENEEILFNARAKLLRHFEKEWKERGVGELKILKSKTDGKIRILMRREQTHKTCANHYLTPEIKLISAKGDEKSFIWCADDFADEVMKREKLCARFKQVETAKEFQKAFIKAQDELKSSSVQPDKNPPPMDKPQLNVAPQQLDKPGFTQGFALSKTATTFNFGQTNTSTPKSETKTAAPLVPIVDASKGPATGLATSSPFGQLSFGIASSTVAPKDAIAPETSKPSPFANFSFSTTTPKTDSPFANIFSKTTMTASDTKTVASQPINFAGSLNPTLGNNDTANKSNLSESEHVDEYEPTTQFKPVIPLPDLVEVQTGEENEDVLFEHRAKLLRFDKSTSEWKERGIGVMKVLVDRNDPNRVRLVMRREQVFKLCCNQRLAKDTVFKYAQNKSNALTWVGQDYSESELQAEILAIRFKTSDICKEFHNVILKAQEKMSADAVTTTAKNENTNGLATKDLSNKTAANNQPKSISKKNESTLPENSFGDKFKPKVGSWSCDACYTSNSSDTLYCIACEQPKDETVPKKSGLGVSSITTEPAKSTFTFGFTTPNANKKTETPKTQTAGFGEQFKPKPGSWTCQACYLSNTADVVYCTACEAPKDDSVPKKETTSNVFAPSSTAPKFQFGFSPTTTVDSAKATSTSNSLKPSTTTTAATIDTTSVTSSNTSTNPKPFDFVAQSGGGFMFGTPITSTTTVNNVFAPASDGKTTFSFSPSTMFGVTNENSLIKNSITKFAVDLNQKSTTNGNDKSDNNFILEKEQFNFTLKPKSPGKAKSPARNISGYADEESDAEDIEEENNTYFAPVIPLPEKVDVVTGEEDEEQLYCHRAKLYRFVSGEWKERGVGEIKILRHLKTKQLRVVMRREKIHKICLNHVLTPDIEYKPKDEKSWHFAANDFSEGEFQSTIFSIRFKNKEIAEDFMAAIQQALCDSTDAGSDRTDGDRLSQDKEGLTDEQIELANRLKLPYSFYRHHDSEKCPGCRGCEADKFTFPEHSSKNEFLDDQPPIPLTMPNVKPLNKSILKQSVLGSPTLNANSDVSSPISKSVFGGSSLFSMPNSAEKTAQESKTMANFSFSLGGTTTETPTAPPLQEEKSENSFISGGFLFGGSSKFGTASDKAKPVFGQSIFGNTINTSTVSPIFGGNATIFGSSTTTASTIFGGTTTTTTTTMFGGTNNSALQSSNGVLSAKSTTDESSNLFSTLNLKPQENQPQPVFGNKPTFQFGGTSFGSTHATGNARTGLFSGLPVKQNTDNNGTNEGKSDNSVQQSNNKENEPKTDATAASNNQSEQQLFRNDPGLSFASLAANASPAANIKTDAPPPDGFFGLKQTGGFSIFLKSGKDVENKSINTSNTSQDGATGHDDASYDPHYEPIIELPELIKVSTGEENEEKLFGERGVLYRYDTTNKEWKERGTGEIKILHHPEKGTYRIILRREQIHKLVLNHAISADFQLKPMNTSGKSYCWGAMNYAENPPALERLAVRFKNSDIAQRFEREMLICIEKAKQRGGELEPEDD